MRLTSFRPKARWVVTILAGLLCLGLGYQLLTWPDSQVQLYNAGVAAYRTGNAEEAVRYFDRSLANYKLRAQDNWAERFIYPRPDRELAAYASFQKAKAYLHLRKGKEAVEAFKESLRLNPGNNYENLTGFQNLSQDDELRLSEAAKTVKYDLELLFKNNKQLAEGEGKGDGQPQPGDGDPKKQKPGDQPGQLPGKGDRKAI
ncbi:MAG: tetratricopeptide repeat protein [Candidatus Melainabacteria bacterium]|nr:tetratricopeptide repeat protein [Candidatus Melainabacteria bacterium]